MIDINTITASFVANKHNMDTYLYINILATHRTGLFPPSGRSQRWVWNRHDPILCSLRKRITRTHAIPYALQMNNSPERGPPTYSPPGGRVGKTTLGSLFGGFDPKWPRHFVPLKRTFTLVPKGTSRKYSSHSPNWAFSSQWSESAMGMEPARPYSVFSAQAYY